MATERRYQSPPGMARLFSRAGLALIPGVSQLPFVGGRHSGQVPELVLTLPSAGVERDRLAAYDRVCGFSLSDTLPPTYPHILAFPLHLALMTDPSFPLPAIGLVHIANSITQHRPIRAGETLSMRVWATPLEPHPRGRQFSLRTEASVDDEVVWEETSTNLRRVGGSGESPPRPDSGRRSEGESRPDSGSGRGPEGESRPAPDRPERPSATAIWRLPADLGRRYASVSGDLNPIHMHPLSAKLFGFPAAIAHGMWTKARCLAALQGRLPSSFTVQVSFRRPILLPASVQFGEAAEGPVVRFGVWDARRGTPHLEGSISPTGA